MAPEAASPEFDPERSPRGLGVVRAIESLAHADSDAARVRGVLAALSTDESVEVLGALNADRRAEVLLILPPERAAELLARLAPSDAAGSLVHLPSDERADLLSAVDPAVRGAIVDLLPETLQAEFARLQRYPPDTAGGLMETELVAHVGEATVRDVIRDLRANQQRYAALGVQYLYVVDDSRRLRGVAPMRELLLAPEDAALASLARPGLVSVKDTASTQELADLFDTHPYQGVPVVDAAGVLLGTVSRADVTESEHHQSEEQYRRSQGIIGGEELRSMPVALRVRRRGSWLCVNLVLCLGGAAVIAAFQETLAKAIVVAAMLPVISATSGNAGMQAATVSIRELTLGVVDSSAWRRVVRHELALAALLAAPLGAAVAGIAALWGSGWMVGAAVGVAMTLNTVVALTVGALCPLALRRFNVDPALASGPITTTLADVTGFALTFALVGWLA